MPLSSNDLVSASLNFVLPSLAKALASRLKSAPLDTDSFGVRVYFVLSQRNFFIFSFLVNSGISNGANPCFFLTTFRAIVASR